MTSSEATRALAFSHAHPATDVGYVSVVNRLEALLTRADALAVREREGLMVERAAVARRLQFCDALTRQLRHLSRVGTLAAKDDPSLTTLFKLPNSRGPHLALLAVANAMRDSVVAHQPALIALGLGEQFLANLTSAIEGFESAGTLVHSGRRDHVGARADLVAISTELMDLVRILDGVNRERFASDADLLAAWASARNLLGPMRPKKAGVETPLPAQAAGQAA